jgi:hypothetical protein
LEGKYDLASAPVALQILAHREVSSDLHKIVKLNKIIGYGPLDGKYNLSIPLVTQQILAILA